MCQAFHIYYPDNSPYKKPRNNPYVGKWEAEREWLALKPSIIHSTEDSYQESSNWQWGAQSGAAQILQ